LWTTEPEQLCFLNENPVAAWHPMACLAVSDCVAGIRRNHLPYLTKPFWVRLGDDRKELPHRIPITDQQRDSMMWELHQFNLSGILPRALAGNACEGITTTPATRVSDYATLAELLIAYG
jgi:hypothetical protein